MPNILPKLSPISQSTLRALIATWLQDTEAGRDAAAAGGSVDSVLELMGAGLARASFDEIRGGRIVGFRIEATEKLMRLGDTPRARRQRGRVSRPQSCAALCKASGTPLTGFLQIESSLCIESALLRAAGSSWLSALLRAAESVEGQAGKLRAAATPKTSSRKRENSIPQLAGAARREVTDA